MSIYFKMRKAVLRALCALYGHQDEWVTSWGDRGVVCIFSMYTEPIITVVYECRRCGRLEAVYKSEEQLYEMRKLIYVKPLRQRRVETAKAVSSGSFICEDATPKKDEGLREDAASKKDEGITIRYDIS